jgi:sulfite exporter TauE/SafE
LDQWISLLKNFFPWMSLLAGLAGSLHCVGMCGGLVSSSCSERSDILKYQLGRLLGYLFLGGIAASIGSYFKDLINHPILSYLPTLLVGGLFIYFGLIQLIGLKFPMFFSSSLGSSYQKLWNVLTKLKLNFSRSFVIGGISILLPCGLLYGVILGTLAIQSIPLALLSIAFFWLGTLPAMVLAPEIFRKILKPFQHYRPKMYAFSLIFLGLTTIGYRYYLLQQTPDNSCGCHQKSAN